MPAIFTLRLINHKNLQQHYRKLLNTEKIMFWTNNEGVPLPLIKEQELGYREEITNFKSSFGDYYVLVHVERESISYNKEYEKRPIEYNIGKFIENILFQI